MDMMTIAIAAALLALVVTVLLVRYRAKNVSSETSGLSWRTTSPAPPESSTPDADRELLALVARGSKIEAIKRVRELTGLGLKEAKEYVESIDVAGAAPPIDPAETRPSISGDLEAEVRALVADGSKIGAIKRLVDRSGMSLSEAKRYVEALPATLTTISARPQAFTDSPIPTPEEIERAARGFLARGSKIEAIKHVRELTGLGLKEAKEYVDALERRTPSS
jgi:ribosomal protein L7/L12